VQSKRDFVSPAPKSDTIGLEPLNSCWFDVSGSVSTALSLLAAIPVKYCESLDMVMGILLFQ
ncbi:MAG: hypothetical protein ACOYPR_13530, partial [Saprospiraceae bacterium]